MGVELEEVSKLPSEEMEVLEQPLEEVLDEVLGWKGCMVVLGIARRGSELEKLQSISETGRQLESKEC